MLKTGPRPVPTFDRTKFRGLADKNTPQGGPLKIDPSVDALLLDPELKITVELMLGAYRVIDELHMAKKIIREAGVRASCQADRQNSL